MCLIVGFKDSRACKIRKILKYSQEINQKALFSSKIMSLLKKDKHSNKEKIQIVII